MQPLVMAETVPQWKRGWPTVICPGAGVHEYEAEFGYLYCLHCPANFLIEEGELIQAQWDIAVQKVLPPFERRWLRAN